MDSIALLRALFKQAHTVLEGTLGSPTDSQLSYQPAGRPVPIGGLYGHVVLSQDALVNGMLKGAPPLQATSFAGKTGFSEPHPQMPPWDDWARRVRVDLPTARAYAQAVYANTDAYLASLKPADLERPLDLTAIGLGPSSFLNMIDAQLSNVHWHTGEISAVKGMQGLQGYPF